MIKESYYYLYQWADSHCLHPGKNSVCVTKSGIQVGPSDGIGCKGCPYTYLYHI